MKFNVPIENLIQSQENLEIEKNKWKDFYSNPQYIGKGLDVNSPYASFDDGKGGIGGNSFNNGLISPSTLAPHGSTARVGTTSPMAENLIDVNQNAQQLVDSYNSKFNPSSDYMSDIKDEGNRIMENNTVSPESFDIGSAASGGLNLGISAFNSFSGVDGSNKESDAKTIQMAAQGAKLGMTIGGPIGGGVGAVAGLVGGLINKGADRRKRANAANEKNKQNHQRSVDERRIEYQIKQNEKDIQTLTSMNKSKLNYL